jgi:hypothetical protein
MPRIFDNIRTTLSDGLRAVLPEAHSCSLKPGKFSAAHKGQMELYLR